LTKIFNPGRHSPAAERNCQPILEVLRSVLPAQGLVLEIASGTGQHVMHFAGALPGLEWQPSDPDAASRQSINDWMAAARLPNVRAPLDLDVRAMPWPLDSAAALVCINMIHISPWEAACSLMKGAGAILQVGSIMYLYGPYRLDGRHTSPSNEAFDADLRARDPAWGVRDLEAVQAIAGQAGFMLEQTVPMPANNLSVILRRVAT